jgi:hypothetical protein
MSSLKVILLDNFEADKISIGKVKDNRSGMGKSANLSYDDGRFFLAATDIRFPFGASAKPAEYRKGDKDQWTLQCELTEEQIQRFKQLDEHIVDCCLKSEDVMAALKLTGKQKCREVLESKYWDTLKYSKDKDGNIKDQYPPTIRINIPNDNADGFSCTFFSSASGNSEQMKIDNIPDSENNIGSFLAPNVRGSVLIGMSLWISSSGFGVSLRANQIKAEPRKALAKGVCLLDNLAAIGAGTTATATNQVQDPELEEDDEEEAKSEANSEPEPLEEVEEEVSEEEAEPEPSPPKSKRPAKKPATAKK